MSAGNIEKIELITTPPANLDAEGNAGYINIVLKVNDAYGTNGSFSLTMGYGNRDMPQASLNFNHRQGKVNLYGDYSFSRIHAEQDWLFYHQVSNGERSTENYTYTYRNTVQRNHNARLGMDYQLNKKTVIGVLLSGYNNKWTMDANNVSSILINKREDTVLRIANTEKNHWTNYGANVNLQHMFREGEKLSFNVDYLHYRDDNPVSYLNNYYDGEKNFLYQQQTRSSKLTPIRFWVNAADYSRQLGKKVNLEAGLKSTVSNFYNDVQIDRLNGNQWVVDPGLSAKYTLNENIEAAYASFNITADPKTELKAGLRYEYTNSNLGSDSLKNIETLKATNLLNNKTVSAVLTIPLTLKSWWSLSVNVTGTWSRTSAVYNKSPLHIDQKNLNINMVQTIKLPKDFSFELSGFYQSPTVFGIYRAAAFGSLDAGVQKKLGKNNFRLAYSNILNTMKFHLSVDRPDLNLVLRDDLLFDFPAVRFTYTRSFGNDKLKATRQRTTGSEDERGRVN